METKDRVMKVIANFLEEMNVKNALQMLKDDNDLSHYEFNSISFIKLIVALEEEFNVEFADEVLDMAKFQSLDDLSDYIDTCLQVMMERL